MNTKFIYSVFLSGLIRYLLSISKYSKSIENHVEVSTPLNSFKRVKEGAFLYANDVDPYEGDVYHENPFILFTTSFLLKNMSGMIPIIIILLDLLTAIFIYLGTKAISENNFEKQQKNLSTYAENTTEIQLKKADTIEIPTYCALAYLFNPYSILNCVGLTTTVISNFLLSIMIFSLSRNMKILCILSLAIETQKNFYSFVLIVPVALRFSESSKSKVISRILTIIAFLITLLSLHCLSFQMMKSFNFIDSTYGFIIHCRELLPNIGLFWYFFTEMFDHFRNLFLYTFQLNSTILYLLPLTFTFKDSPEFLLTILLSLISVFRSYPCVGDIAFCMSLIPLWKRIFQFMSHNFIVVAAFLVTSILGPTVYHLWMYANSANANFYFGVTLVFCTANIFLLTDLTFAYLKMEFCLKNGISFDKSLKLSLD
ncbi:CLUMA_CG014056, isoform A [Clunio marinus]|uniref:CLUMA_CG014056, isoform A n=1 Tax=Clunio marinus TaxID=568069 RepID=A0A1J1IMM2_9DIPT|nr:CLUMA_CG014056, isoform A [Clunio marinus]